MTELLPQMTVDLLLPASFLDDLIRSAPHRYKVYKILKKSGVGTRTIAHPAREVKRLQYWVIKHVLEDMRIHPAAKAYVRGVGIADNAAVHAGNPYLLKLDFKDFFPSIRGEDFQHYAEQHLGEVICEEDIERLKRILFWRPRGKPGLQLSIGAPSSPLVSNILLFEFDRDISEFCEPLGIRYTRYADDLTFSMTEKPLRGSVEERVKRLLSELSYPSLRLNEQKTFYGSRACRRRVTGLVLTNDGKVSLGRERKRKIRAEVHHYRTGRLNAEQIKHLRGMIAFARGVEPSFVERLERKYGALVF